MVAAVPYGLLGPGYVLDDWFALANARFDGWWMAAGRDQWLARPGAGAAYAVVFGVVGQHPLVAYLVSVALVAAAAELLRRLLGSVGLPAGLALATSLVWVALPNHGSLLYWASAANITLALVLLLAGLLTDGRLAQPALLAASVLCYEATLPAAVIGLVVVPRLRTGRWEPRPLARAMPLLLVATAWIVVFFHPAKRDVDVTADLTLMVPAHFGWGVFAWRPLANVAGVTCVVVAAVVLARRRPLRCEGWMIAAGFVTIVVGTLPFARYFYQPLGPGDRANVVAAVGAALVWTAIGALSFALPRVRAVAVVVAAVLLASVAAEQWHAARAWHAAASDARAVMRSLENGAEAVPTPPLRRNVAGVLDASTFEAMADLAAGTRGR